MDTKTAKIEAMSLLAKDSLTAKEAARLDRLTADQAKIKLMYQVEWFSFVNNVDDCLLLPLPAGCWWLMTSRTPNTRCSAAIVLERHRQYAATIPLAMLKCWWSIQPD